MELVKNRASGKTFIVIDNSEETYFLLITPEGKLKRLKRHLFGPLISVDPGELEQKLDIKKIQLDKYSELKEYGDYSMPDN